MNNISIDESRFSEPHKLIGKDEHTVDLEFANNERMTFMRCLYDNWKENNRLAYLKLRECL